MSGRALLSYRNPETGAEVGPYGLDTYKIWLDAQEGAYRLELLSAPVWLAGDPGGEAAARPLRDVLAEARVPF